MSQVDNHNIKDLDKNLATTGSQEGSEPCYDRCPSKRRITSICIPLYCYSDTAALYLLWGSIATKIENGPNMKKKTDDKD